MPVYLKDEQLINLFIAVIFREAGYIAGVPRRYIEGRGGIYQIPFLIVDRNITFMGTESVLIPRYIAGEFEEQWQQVLWLNGVVRDLQEARPKKFISLPHTGKQSIGEYFHKLYGGARSEGEFLSVDYKGIIISIGNIISPKIREYAVSQGIIYMNIPLYYQKKAITDWINIIRRKLFSSFENNTITVKGLLHHTRKIPDYRSLLKKIRRQNQCLSPEENHDLLTVLYALLKEDELRPLLNYLRKLTVAIIDSQPVLIKIDNITITNLIKGTAGYFYDLAKKHKGRSHLVSKRLGFQGEVQKKSDQPLYHVVFYPDENYFSVPEELKGLIITAFLSGEQVDALRNSKSTLSLTVKEGLVLSADIYLVK